jgi:acyl-CoA dehydrogenase
MARSGIADPSASLTAIIFGLPPIIEFESEELQERILSEVLLNKKRICIAIAEPEAGSDVANIQTTATETEDGEHYIINGVQEMVIEPVSCHLHTLKEV